MPFVRIDALRADADRLAALGRAVHDALVETVGIPPDDLFQVLTAHDGTHGTLRYGTFPGVDRDDDLVYVAITLRRAAPRRRSRRSTGASRSWPSTTPAPNRATCSSS
ncbi:tautomerase family protein [Nonomuraea antimicrobica]